MDDYETYQVVSDGEFGDYEYAEYGGLSNFMGEDLVMAYRRAETHEITDEIWNLVTNCMTTILKQGFGHVKLLLFLCLLFRFCTVFINKLFRNHKKSLILTHIFSSGIGTYALFHMFSDIFMHLICILFVFLFVTFSLNVCLAKHQKGGLMASLGAVAFILISEVSFANPAMWNRIRGLLLITAMKIISVSIDRDKKVKKLPNLVEFFGYCFHPGSLVFGPWISFQEYEVSIENPRPLSVSWGICILKSAFQAAFCLLLSDCVLSYMFIDSSNVFAPSILPIVANNWMLSYETAVSFHLSHFYVCYLATLTCLLSGVGAVQDLKTLSKSENKKKSVETGYNLIWSKFVITKPFSVEIPRSMLTVAVAWNIPISKWLKMYVFDSARFMGDFVAVIFTYAASAMLHGLSFHLAAILLSLGFYTYTEHSLRKRLAEIFHCPSIEARPKCTPTDTPLWAKLFNLAWIFINIMHLTYLGSMFEYQNEETDTGGFSLNYTLSKWSQLGYTSHIFALACFVFNWLI